MASVKLGALLIRTISKPIANQLKNQAQQHERFRNLCIGLAQWSYRTEVRLRTSLLGENPKAVKPLSDARAIQNGANTIAEGFLFAVAATLVLAETWRSARSQERRRDKVDDDIDDLTTRVQELTSRMKEMQDGLEARWDDERIRTEELSRILQRIVEIGLRGGWAELEDRPLKLPSYLAQTTRLQEAPQTEGLKPNTAVDQDTRNS